MTKRKLSVVTLRIPRMLRLEAEEEAQWFLYEDVRMLRLEEEEEAQ